MDTPVILATAGFSLLVVALLKASLLEGKPLPQLGKQDQPNGCVMFLSVLNLTFISFISRLGVRPAGTGLLFYFINFFVHGQGVWGHDPILGAVSPPLRVACHAALVLLLCAVATLFTSPSNDLSLFVSIAIAVAYGIFSLVVHHVMPGVSVPGGPRPHKIQRVPAWPDQQWSIPKHSLFRYATAQESHDISHAVYADHRLTGEPFGRDIWTTAAPTPTRKVDEQLVQQLASGGRDDPGFNPHENPNSCDRVLRAQLIRNYIAQGGTPPNTRQPATTVAEAARKAVHFYSMLQTSDGHWSGDYGGPHFLLPGLIIIWYVMGQPEGMFGGTNAEAIELLQLYIRAHQQVDGGWGTHIESPSTMFGTSLMYVALRLLGAAAEDPVCERGRNFLHDNGGALYTSSWAKFYLCILGVMEWDGHNSTPPEMWMLPNWCPFHPGRMWCHARMVYCECGNGCSLV